MMNNTSFANKFSKISQCEEEDELSNNTLHLNSKLENQYLANSKLLYPEEG